VTGHEIDLLIEKANLLYPVEIMTSGRAGGMKNSEPLKAD